MKKWLFVITLTLLLLLPPARVLAKMSVIETAPSKSSSSDDQFVGYQESVIKNNVNGVVNSTGLVTNNVNDIFKLIATSILGPPLPGSNGKIQGSLIQNMGSSIAVMYKNPAANTEVYIADVLNSAGVATPAYAQGLGFSSLTPVLEAWKTFRNIAYIFFVVIMLMLGFMIMLRQKIGGQAAVTAQQAIPRVIMALLAVTFSYAIAGLLIDMMYLLMFFLISFFGEQGAINFSLFKMGTSILTSGSSTAFSTVYDFIDSMLAGGSEGEGVVGAVGDVLSFFGGALAAAVVAVSVAIGLFRLWFELLKTYIAILVNIILSPILLMFEAIPGRKAFGKWVKGLVGNLMAFPTVLIIFIIFDKLTGQLSGSGDLNSVITSGGFVPPYLGANSASSSVPLLIAIGMILIMTDLVKEAKKAMGAKGTLFEQFGGAVADSLKRGWKGDQLIPGLGFTDTSKMPLIGSGKDFGRKMATTGYALGQGLGGGMLDIRNFPQAFHSGVGRGGARAAKLLGEKQLYQDRIKQLEEEEKAAKAAIPKNRNKK